MENDKLTNTRFSNYELRTLCIKNNWFTCGSNEQYTKFFDANNHNINHEELITILWICSDIKNRTDIQNSYYGKLQLKKINDDISENETRLQTKTSDNAILFNDEN